MGFWGTTFRVVQDVTSLGGTYRLRENSERLDRLHKIYLTLQAKLDANHWSLATLVASVQGLVDKATRHLQRADEILNPLRVSGRRVDGVELAFGGRVTMVGKQSSFHASDPVWNSQHLSTAVGAGAGVAAMAGSWGTIQIMAHASTGAAMAGLHGAAASSAGWAWFGGGSLAAHGGGMALGHVVLPGIGSAIAVAVSATVSHRQANEVADLCTALESANTNNNLILRKTELGMIELQRYKDRISNEGECLANQIKEAEKALFRFGWFSHLFRLVRHWLKGSYYNSSEFHYVEQVGRAADRFTAAMSA
jgi:hypothetical protein